MREPIAAYPDTRRDVTRRVFEHFRKGRNMTDAVLRAARSNGITISWKVTAAFGFDQKNVTARDALIHVSKRPPPSAPPAAAGAGGGDGARAG